MALNPPTTVPTGCCSSTRATASASPVGSRGGGSLATNASLAPALVRANTFRLGSKSAVSEKSPVTYTVPSAAAARSPG